MPAVEIVDPVGYSWVWTLVGIVLLMGVVAWFVWVFWSTRKRPGEPDGPRAERARRPATTMPTVNADPWAAVRNIYLDKLREVESLHARGQLDARATHLEIRRIMREFTKARTGIDAETFTAADAARVSLTGPLAKTLKNLSYPSFARSSTSSAQRAIGQAQDVVRRW